VLCF
jgi:hypothetical protein